MRGRHVLTTVDLRPAAAPHLAGGLAGVLAPPVGGSPAPGYAVEQLARVAASTPSGAGGAALLTFGPPPTGYLWLVQSVLVHVDNDPGSVASVFVGDEPATINLVAGTTRGDLDTADGDPPIYVPGGSKVLVQWASAGVGNLCTAVLQYAVGRLPR